MKAFFGKIWAWVLANKVLAAIIAGGTAVVLAVAIAVPCGVSASKKRKAAQEETSIPGDNSGSQSGGQGGQQGGGEQGGGQQGGGSGDHTHSWATTWSHDATNHWHACSGCDEKNNVEAHKFGAWTIVSETKEERTCSTCGYKEEKNHVHTFADAWESDAANHWHESTCGHDVKGSEAAHTTNEYGFCSVCGRYLGAQFAFEDQGGYFDFVHEQMDMAANQVYFCRISGAISGHMYELEDGDPLFGDPGTNIYDAVSAYTMIDGQPNVVDLSGTIPSEIGSDGYLYIKLDATNLYDRDDVWFRIVQNHAPNDFGFCSVDGCDYYCGLLRTVGVSTNRHFESGKKVFFRYQVVKGHEYYITHTGLTASEINAYSISSTDGSFVIVPNIKIAGGGVFPADAADSYLYVVITPSATNDGSITVNYTGHGSLDSYGFCNACGEYDGTPVVGMNIPVINLEFGEEDYYRFPIKQHFAYELEDSTPEMTDGVTKGYLHLSTGFEEYDFDMANYIEDVGDGYMYLVINCTYVGGISNGELTIHDYEEPLDSHGFYVPCNAYGGTELVVGEEAEPFNLVAGVPKYFRFQLSEQQLEDEGFYLGYGYDITYYDVTVGCFHNDTFETIDSYAGSLHNEDFYTPDETDDGYIYIIVCTTADYSNITGFIADNP